VEKLLRNFYWFSVREDAAIYIARSDVCASIKPPHKVPRAPLGTMPVGGVLDRLSTDILGPFPESEMGNKYVLTVSDHFTKWVEIFAVPDQTAITCANKILNEVIARFGCPLDLHSDQGRNYESHVFAELCKLLEIRKTRTASGNAKCNGQTERFNRTLVRMIKAYMRGEQNKWDENLGCLAAAYRATPHETTGFSPNLLMLGREVRLPAEIMFGTGKAHPDEEVSSYGDYVSKLRERFQKAHDITRTHLQAAANRRKEYYDAKCSLNKYQRGSMVWILSDITQLHITPKLRHAYEGPYLIIQKLNDLDYRVQLNARGKNKIVHHNRLKPYQGDTYLPWARSALNNK
jgi:transposase InsO family protein